MPGFPADLQGLLLVVLQEQRDAGLGRQQQRRTSLRSNLGLTAQRDPTTTTATAACAPSVTPDALTRAEFGELELGQQHELGASRESFDTG